MTAKKIDLKQYLKTNAIRVEEFAKVLGCDRVYLYTILRGRYVPSHKLALQIEKFTFGKIPASHYKKKRAEKMIQKGNLLRQKIKLECNV